MEQLEGVQQQVDWLVEKDKRDKLSLFNQLKKNEEKFPGRNTEAEKYIKNLILKQPNSIYYIVQTVLVQESVIKKLNTELNVRYIKIYKDGMTTKL